MDDYKIKWKYYSSNTEYKISSVNSMNILTRDIEKKIQQDIIVPIQKDRFEVALEHIPRVIDELYANIPDNRRISYGQVHTIKVLTEYLSIHLEELGAPVFQIASNMFDRSDEFKCQGVALGMLSYHGLNDLESVLPYFKIAASASHWDVREFTQMFFRKLIKKYPKDAKKYLQKLVSSKDPNIRRFVSETLRPVQENKWFYNDPEYSLSILRKLFKESSAYPRTSVGNNLSDLARRLPELVYEIVADLVVIGDKHSYWIAYRACRNLVKTEPIRVMDLLNVNEYKYKKRVYKRDDYSRD